MNLITEEEAKRLKEGAILEFSDSKEGWGLGRFREIYNRNTFRFITQIGDSWKYARWPEGVNKEEFLKPEKKLYAPALCGIPGAFYISTYLYNSKESVSKNLPLQIVAWPAPQPDENGFYDLSEYDE